MRGQCVSTPGGDVQTLTPARAHLVICFFFNFKVLIFSLTQVCYVQSPYFLKH